MGGQKELIETLKMYANEISNLRELLKESFNPAPNPSTKRLLELLRLSNNQLADHIRIMEAPQKGQPIKLTV